ncbi:MAG: hypothetical protein ACRDRJ_24520 [Streptosporangiaceae bacterium]
MRALLAAIRCEKGGLDHNLSSHLSLLASAASAGCDLGVQRKRQLGDIPV